MPETTAAPEDDGAYKYVPSINHSIAPVLPTRADRILDIGGGRGDNAVHVRDQLGGSFACVADVSQDAVANAIPELDRAVLFDGEAPQAVSELMAEAGPFDLVLLLDVLEHLRDPWRLIAQIHDALPVGGSVVASIPNVQNYRAIVRTVTGTWDYRDTGLFDRTHLRYFGRGSALRLMTGTGLTLRGVASAYGGRTGPQRLDAATDGILSRYLTLQWQVRAEKTSDAPARDPGSCGDAVTAR